MDNEAVVTVTGGTELGGPLTESSQFKEAVREILYSLSFFYPQISFSGRLRQYIGKVLRPAPGKEKANIYDYVDSKVVVLKAASRSRRRVYEEG